MKRVLLVDNLDSFTHNLAQALGTLGAKVAVWRAGAFTLDDVEAWAPTHLVISPGPGHPDEAHASRAVLDAWIDRVPVLGVCLGHQILVRLLGGVVGRASSPVHGKASAITHCGEGLFLGLPQPLEVGRYHSLAALEVPPALQVAARTTAGEVMAVRIPGKPVHGVQFHPESILTPHGDALLANFLRPPVAIERLDHPTSDELDQVRAVHGAVLRGDPGRALGVPARLLHVARDQDRIVGFKVGGQRGTTFHSDAGAVLPSYRGLGIGRRLMRAQHADLANLLRDGGTIRTTTLNLFRPMLLLNLSEGFLVDDVVAIPDGGGTIPQVRLSRRLDQTPIVSEPLCLSDGAGTSVVAVDRRAVAALIALLRDGYDLVGQRVTRAGLQLLLERVDGPGFGPATYVPPTRSRPSG